MKLGLHSLDTVANKFSQFSDWASFVDVCTQYHSGKSSRNVDSSDGWAGTRTWEEAVNFARNGQANTTEALQTVITRMTELMAPAEVPEMYLDVTTDFGWDMGTAITGNPQAGINFHNVADEAKKQVSLILSGNNLASVSANAMFYRGTLAYCMYLTLTQLGYDVTVDLVFSNIGRKYQHTTRVNLVSPGEILDLSVIAYACTSPSVFRRLYFAFMETIWDKNSRDAFSVGWGYGRTVETPAEYQGDIYLSPNVTGQLFHESDYLGLIEHANRLIEEFQEKEN